MARRMIDPSFIIKSQVVDDKHEVDLNEILEKYGTDTGNARSITLQMYCKDIQDDYNVSILNDNGIAARILLNTAFTISKNGYGDIYIGGLLIDNYNTMNLLQFLEIGFGEYNNGLILTSMYEFDLYVIKV